MKKLAFVAMMLLMCVMADAVNVIRNSAPADTNQWIIFRKVVNVTGDPAKNFVKIALRVFSYFFVFVRDCSSCTAWYNIIAGQERR